MALSLIAAGVNVQPPSYDEDAAAIASWFADYGLRFRAGHFAAGLALLLVMIAAAVVILRTAAFPRRSRQRCFGWDDGIDGWAMGLVLPERCRPATSVGSGPARHGRLGWS